MVSVAFIVGFGAAAAWGARTLFGFWH